MIVSSYDFNLFFFESNFIDFKVRKFQKTCFFIEKFQLIYEQFLFFKISYQKQEAEYFEKSWLLLSDIYIQTSKFDSATDLLKQCLTYNKVIEVLC